jgi:hypothetical protein
MCWVVGRGNWNTCVLPLFALARKNPSVDVGYQLELLLTPIVFFRAFGVWHYPTIAEIRVLWNPQVGAVLKRLLKQSERSPSVQPRHLYDKWPPHSQHWLALQKKGGWLRTKNTYKELLKIFTKAFPHWAKTHQACSSLGSLLLLPISYHFQHSTSKTVESGLVVDKLVPHQFVHALAALRGCHPPAIILPEEHRHPLCPDII